MAENKEKLRNALRDVHKQNINPYLIRDWSWMLIYNIRAVIT